MIRGAVAASVAESLYTDCTSPCPGTHRWSPLTV